MTLGIQKRKLELGLIKFHKGREMDKENSQEYVRINKSTLIILGVIVVLGVIIFYNSLGSGGGVPRIQVIPSSYDFGNMPHEAVNHTFMVKNMGTGPLEIKRVSTSCGCTSAKISLEKILPNQVANLWVKFDPNLMEEKVEGEVLRVVYIKSNDPEQPEVEVEIKANVII